jgi:hypothetical protein
MISTPPFRRRLCGSALACLTLLSGLVGAGSASAATVAGAKGKLDSHLAKLVVDQQRGMNTPLIGRANGEQVDRVDRVLADVYVDGDAAQAASALRVAGMDVQVATNKAPVHIVEGWVPLGAADGIAGLDVVRAVIPVMGYGVEDDGGGGGGTNTGSVLSQGDAAHNGPQARATDSRGNPGPTGADQRVGVISDSINKVGFGVAQSQSTGDLPSNVHILTEGPAGSTDEGRAMSEIMYDEAPGMNDLWFSSGTASGAAGKADSINKLSFVGAKIIADDIFYLGEPFFQEGVVAQAVDNAKAHGVAYFASAGNRGTQSWAGNYIDSLAVPGFENFNYPGDQTTQFVTDVPPGNWIEFELQWDEPWGRDQTDLDLFLGRADTGAGLASDLTDNRATGIPAAYVYWKNTTAAAVPVRIGIQRYAGTRRPYMKYIARGDFGPFQIAQFPSFGGSVDPDAASADGAIAVAAVDAADPGHNDAEPYSSRAPVVRFFDTNGNRLNPGKLILHPQLAAADDVSTSVPGFMPFTGTSAAAPAAAGIAMLVKSAQPALSVDELTSIMTNPSNAIDCTDEGRPDTSCGNGFILADRAVHQAFIPSVSSASPSPGAIDVYPNASVVIGFNQPMNHFGVQSAFSLVRTSDGAPVDGTFSWFGDTAVIFKPKADLQSGVNYTAQVTDRAFSNRFIALGDTYTTAFTTAVRPVAETVTPAVNATGVSRSTNVVVGFSKAMNTTATQAAFTFKRVSDGAAIPGSVVWFGNALVFKPSSPLTASTRYIATIGAAAKDTAGNALLNPRSWTFTTGTSTNANTQTRTTLRAPGTPKLSAR